MTLEAEKEIAGHINAIAKILYQQAQPEQVEILAKIEETVREQTLKQITPQIGVS